MIIGPIFFSLYLLPLLEVLNENNNPYNFYADDSQLFLEITREKDNLAFLENNEEYLAKIESLKIEFDEKIALSHPYKGNRLHLEMAEEGCDYQKDNKFLGGAPPRKV